MRRLAIFFASMVAVVSAAVFLPWAYIVSFLAAVIIVALLVRYLAVATLMMIFLFPFLGIEINLARFPSLSTVPLIGSINAPVTDVLGMFILIAWILTVIYRIWNRLNEREPLMKIVESVRLPALFPAMALWGSGLLSLRSVPLQWFSASLKYLARPVIFSYTVFVLPVVNIIRTERLLRLALWCLWGAGSIASLFGLVSFAVVEPVGFPRATVFGIGGIAPLGLNHNLLAETLIAAAPLGLALLEWYSRRSVRLFIIIGSIFQVVIALLTFARTAWIALVLQLFIWFLTSGQAKTKVFFRRIAPALVVFIPLVIIMTTVSLGEVVQSSTMTRADMARIALYYFERNPVIGQGVGTFMPSLWTIRSFTLDYGTPLDAHGVVWKLLFEQGILGLAAFSALVLACIYRAWRAYKAVYWSSGRIIMQSVLMMMIGSVTYQLFNTMYYTSKLWIPMGVGLAASYIYGAAVTTKRI